VNGSELWRLCIRRKRSSVRSRLRKGKCVLRSVAFPALDDLSAFGPKLPESLIRPH
jgi:hypothetical protein